MKKYEQKAEKCVVSINFKPNKTFWIATNTNDIEVPNTNFTKYVKNDFIQIKFSQIFPNATRVTTCFCCGFTSNQQYVISHSANYLHVQLKHSSKQTRA